MYNLYSLFHRICGFVICVRMDDARVKTDLPQVVGVYLSKMDISDLVTLQGDIATIANMVGDELDKRGA